MRPETIELHPAPLHLSNADPILAKIIAQVGAYTPRWRPSRFHALARVIIYQQLAGRAALAIYNRFVALFGSKRFPTAEQVLAMPERRMRSAGLSKAKAKYIRALAEHVVAKKLDFHRFAKMDDEEIIANLTQVPGIGRWTAEMFLMFHLGRPDVLPVGDLGFRSAIMKAYGLATMPKPQEIQALAEKWRPHRSAAVWYLWRSVDIALPADAKRPIAKRPIAKKALAKKRPPAVTPRKRKVPA